MTMPETQSSPRPMTLVDRFSLPEISDPRLSPSGEQVVFVQTETDWEKRRFVGHIWLASVDGSLTAQLTRGEGESSPRWSPDGRSTAFLAETGDGDEKRTRLYLLSTAGGERRPLGDHPTSVSDIAWSPDGRSVYYIASDEAPDQKKQRKERKEPFKFEEELEQRHLWRVDVQSGERQRLTGGDFSIVDYAVSPDGSCIVYNQAPSPLLDDMMNRAELWSMLPDGGQQRALIEGIYPGAQARFSPDNQQVLFLAGANDAFEPYYNAKVFLLPAAGGKHQRLFADHSFEVLNAEWSADGEAIIFLANTGVRADLFQYHLATGALTQLTSGDHGIRGWHYLTGRGLHALVVADAHSNGDIWVLDERSPNQLSQVTHLHDHLPTTFKLPRLDAVQWPGEDGVEVEGLLYYPVDYREGQRYPLVALTHGGPAFSDHFGLGDPYDYAPVLAGHGYLVFQPNYRGSTGYGDEHLRDSVGHYFNQMHRDVMTGVDALIERGLADPDRLIKMGYSAGGVLTKKIVTYTDRFKAASAGAGCTSWLSMYYLGDLRGHRHAWFGGTPWSHQAQEGEPWPADAPIHLYWEHSPLKYAAHVTTPTLLFFGEKDARNPMSEGIIFYRALKGNGVPTHLYITPGKDHGDWDPHQLLFKGNTELEWFARWVLDSSYTWEEAPQATGKVGPSTNENNSITIP